MSIYGKKISAENITVMITPTIIELIINSEVFLG
jgi:hypothetical protein